MKLVFTSDWHNTDKTPSCRIDDYQENQVNKINFIQKTAKKCKAEHILEAGDLTDTPFLSYLYFRKLLRLFWFSIYTVYGQHDLRYRNKGNTPLDALHDSLNGIIKILPPNSHQPLGENVDLYGCSYGEKIPEIINPKNFNILLIHKMLLAKKEKDWEEEYELGNKFLSDNDFNVIVSGDNHQSFHVKSGNKFLFNCGSLMRSTIDQIEHKPCIYIFDTATSKFEQIFIPIHPWQKCFDLEKKIKEEETNEQMESFVQGLSKHKDMGLNFTDNLFTYLKKNKIDSKIIDIIKRSMEDKK